jgi:hypothetical protein
MLILAPKTQDTMKEDGFNAVECFVHFLNLNDEWSRVCAQCFRCHLTIN